MKSEQGIVRPVFGERALIVDDALVVADLHLGLESQLRERGIKIKPQWDEMRKRLRGLLEAHPVRKLIILGDLKHNIPTASPQEYRKLPGLIDDLSDSWEVLIVKGNHDGSLENILKQGVHILKSASIEKVLFSHGHMNIDPKGYEYLVLGHNHPSVELRDELGYGVREPVWLRTTLNKSGIEKYGMSKSPEVIIMPAFNEMLTGKPFNSEGTFLGPLFNNGFVDVGGANLYLLDGTSLGPLKYLKSIP